MLLVLSSPEAQYDEFIVFLAEASEITNMETVVRISESVI
jgi:hypothetical protein